MDKKKLHTMSKDEFLKKYNSVLDEDMDAGEAKRKIDKSKSELESIYRSEFPKESDESSQDYDERIDKLVANYMANADVNENEVNLSEDEVVSMVRESQNPIMTKSELISEMTNQIINEDNKYGDDYDSGENDYSKYLDRDSVSNMGRRLYDDIKNAAEEKFGSANFGTASREMSTSLMAVLSMEMNHKESLEQEAVRLIRNKYGALTEDAVDIDAKITGHPGMGGTSIQKGNIQMSKGTTPPPQGKTEEDLKDEVTKRRIINGMTHGASRKGQNLYHMAGETLDRMGAGAREHYSKIMAANDFLYWAMDRETINSQSSGGAHAGNVRVEIQPSGKPKIIAQGMTFSFLLHELTKGVMELMSLHGTSEDDEVRKYVEDKTDHMDAEPDDIRLGVGIWEKVSQYVDIENPQHEALFYHKLVTLPATQFNDMIRGLVKGDSSSIEMVESIAGEASDDLRAEEYDEAMGTYDDNEEEGDMETLDGEDDDIDVDLQDLLGGGLEGSEPDYSTMSKSELQSILDDAFDRGDMETVKEVGKYI